LAHDFTVTWQFSQREQSFLCYGSNSKPGGLNFCGLSWQRILLLHVMPYSFFIWVSLKVFICGTWTQSFLLETNQSLELKTS
jgi:hypothetical protein